MRRVWFVWLAIGVIGGLLLAAAPGVLLAQNTGSPIQVFVMPPVTTSDNGSTLGVRVPFRLLDAEGNSFGNVRITDVKLWLEDMPPGTIDFGNLTQPIEQISAPLYVTLLIDTSLSMAQELADVRAAARATIERAPDNVFFRIVTFSGAQYDPRLNLRQEFTSDRNNLRNAIDGISDATGGTCYYDAIHAELETLVSAGSVTGSPVRRALMAFTDGQDEVSAEIAPCSRHTIDEVIGSARSKEIPVYTLGLAGNLDEEKLRRLANETQGMAVIGPQSELSALFGEAFAGIVNQYEAEFAVLPAAGRNRAYVEVSLTNTNSVARSAIFEFDSPRSYIPTPTPVPPTETPLPPPTATPVPGLTVFFVPNAAQPDPARGIYRFTITVDQPQIVDQLLIQVMNENRVQIDQQVIDLDGRPTLDFDVEMARLKSNEKYIVEVQATNGAGELIPKPPRKGYDDGPDLILVELEFEHYVESAPPLSAVIRSIQPDAKRGVLLVELDINQPNLVDDYQAFINDESGQKVKDTEMRVYPGGPKVEVPMPDAALQPVDAPEPLEFNLFIRLRTADNVDSDTEPFGFKLTPPAKPGFFAAMWTGLNQNPLIAIAIVVVISSIVLYFVFGRKPARPAYSLARPAEEYTVVAGAAGGGGGGKQHGKLVVDVFETPSPGERKKQSFNRFPCVIGRSSQCDVRLEGDSQLSRRHAQLVLENGRILLTDLGSGNGTFVDDQRIDPNTATPLSDGQVIRLARQTRIRVNISY